MPNRKAIKRKYNKGSKKCIRCGSFHGIIRSYNLYYCRRCFREIAQKLGFMKNS